MLHRNIIKNNIKKRRKLISIFLKRQHYRINNTVDKWIEAYIDNDFHG